MNTQTESPDRTQDLRESLLDALAENAEAWPVLFLKTGHEFMLVLSDQRSLEIKRYERVRASSRQLEADLRAAGAITAAELLRRDCPGTVRIAFERPTAHEISKVLRRRPWTPRA